VASRQVNMRLAELDRARLDRLAAERGLTRSEIVRRLLCEADGAPSTPAGRPSRLEALELLRTKAQGGSVAAMVALERALRLGGRAGVTVFELARVMGTSVRMIEKHYGTLLEGAHAGIVSRLAALEAELEQADEAEASDV
jgi:hypothetical protein